MYCYFQRASVSDDEAPSDLFLETKSISEKQGKGSATSPNYGISQMAIFFSLLNI